jgi:hypothetical protein
MREVSPDREWVSVDPALLLVVREEAAYERGVEWCRTGGGFSAGLTAAGGGFAVPAQAIPETVRRVRAAGRDLPVQVLFDALVAADARVAMPSWLLLPFLTKEVRSGSSRR